MSETRNIPIFNMVIWNHNHAEYGWKKVACHFTNCIEAYHFYNCGHFVAQNSVLIMALMAWNYMGEKSLQFADIYDDIYETL